MRRRSVLQGLAASAGLSLASPAWGQQPQGHWLSLETSHFMLFSSAEERKALPEAQAIERFYTLLTKLVPRDPRLEQKLPIYVAPSSWDFERAGGGVDGSIAGFYDASLELTRAVMIPGRARERQNSMPKNVRAMDARVVLFHEYAHHFMSGNLRMPYPRWYREGFAEFVSTADLTDEGILLGKFTNLRALWLTSGDWLPIEKFLLGQTKSDKDGALFYAQAWLATHFIFTNSERAKGFDAYVHALSKGAHPVDDFEASFGITPKDFDRELKAYKREPIRIFKMNETAAERDVAVDIKRLAPAADELLLPTSYLRVVPLKDRAADMVKLVREEAKKYPADPFAKRSLAVAELWYGEPAVARKILDDLVAAEPGNADVLHLSGLCDLRAAYRENDLALFKRARGAFAAAHRADEAAATSLYRYVECLSRIEDTVTQHMVDVTLNAYDIAPQIQVMSLLAVQMLMQQKRWAEATGVLRPLMSPAHSSGAQTRAQLYADAIAKEQVLPLTFYGAANRLELEYE